MQKKPSGLGRRRPPVEEEEPVVASLMFENEIADDASMLEQMFAMYHSICKLPLPTIETFRELIPPLQAIIHHCNFIFENSETSNHPEDLTAEFFLAYADTLFRRGRCASMDVYE